MQMLNQRNIPFTEKIAVIGAGPSGMACAYYLAEKGYPVTVFDRNLVPGACSCSASRASVWKRRS